MTDVEKARIREAFEYMKLASIKVKQGSIEFIFYTAMSMCLGWVLEEPVYRENFQSHIDRLKSMGVEPSVIQDPKDYRGN